MQVSDDVKAKVQQYLENRPKPLAQALGIEFTEYSKDRVTGTMPVDERTKQPFGLLHGGASVALAESLASIGAWLNIDESKFAAVGLEINANHIRSASSGLVIGTATPIHRGRLTHVWEIRIETEDKQLVCFSRCTIAIIEKK